MSHTHTAMKCFRENVTLFANPQVEPEKFNLYNGLSNLAQAIYNLEQEVQDVKSKLAYIQSAMHSRR